MDFLQHILENTPYAFVSAFILGLMTAISPCPLATNITAIGYIGRDIENRKRVFLNGVMYTLGRAFSYTALAVFIYLGVSKLDISQLFQGWGERLLGPALILIGLFMLDVFKLKLPGFSGIAEKLGETNKGGVWSAFLLGMVFALAFCPYSGVLYFALLIPMTVSSAGGLYLPVVFAVATGMPVLIFAWLLAFAVGNVGKLYNRINVFERGFRKVVAVLFILVGMYYITVFLIG